MSSLGAGVGGRVGGECGAQVCTTREAHNGERVDVRVWSFIASSGSRFVCLCEYFAFVSVCGSLTPSVGTVHGALEMK